MVRYEYLTITEYITILIELIIELFKVPAENNAPCEKYVINIVLVNMAGNMENMPPNTGPPIFPK